MSPPNPKKGRGTHLRLPPAPALGPTPAPSTKPPRRQGPGLLGGRLDAAGPGDPRVLGPRRPPIAGESRVPVPDVKDALPGAGILPRRPGPQPLRRRVPEKARRSPRIPPATPEVPASGVESPGRPAAAGSRAAGARQRRPDVGAEGGGGGSTSCRRPFAPPHPPARDASNQFPSFPKGPVLALLP